MTDYFVGPGGSNSNSGLTWALRWLDFTNVTTGNFPASGGNRLIVGPGTYRQTLTCRIGASGNRHEYRGDPTGFLTDGVGGVVRITGSDNDITATRATCVVTDDNVVVSGFRLDMATAELVGTSKLDNSIIEDCVLYQHVGGSNGLNYSFGTASNTFTIRRCLFYNVSANVRNNFVFSSTSPARNQPGVVENCIFVSGGSYSVSSNISYGYSVRACTFGGVSSSNSGISISGVTTEGVVTITHNVFLGTNIGIDGTAGNSHVENWNQFNNAVTPRQNISAGADSTTVARWSGNQVFQPLQGLVLGPLAPMAPNSLNPDRYSGDTGTGIPTTDFFGIARPTAHAKRSLGAIQFHDVRRSTTQVRSGATSLQLADAARHQIRVPYTGLGTVTVKVYVRRESDYAGTLPGMVIKQPWRSDTTVVDTGSANAWNLIQTNYTPTSGSRWFIVELYSDNTASSGAYNVWFDDLDITNA